MLTHGGSVRWGCPGARNPERQRRAYGRITGQRRPRGYENGIMARVRMDKWLWAARFFKTRALAARACELGRIESNGQPAKAGREVRVGDLLLVKNDSGDFRVEILLL